MIIDIGLNAYLKHHRYGLEYTSYDDGAGDFINLLRMLERVSIFNLGWCYGSDRLWQSEVEYIKNSRRASEASGWADEEGSIYIIDNSTEIMGYNNVYYSFDYSWGSISTILNGDIERPNPKFGILTSALIDMVDVITRWKRPQHLAFGPTEYMVNHQPLDRTRMGIRWIGWIPFEISPSDVPEAEIVRPMNGGTLIVTQSRFWQARERHPDYSADAIRRVQEVELRLNSLGVLPTGSELLRGDWGS